MNEQQASTLDSIEMEPWHLVRVGLGALGVAVYATWMAADVLARWLTFPVVAVLAAILLVDRDPHEQFVFLGYAFAGLFVLTPVLMILPDALGDFGEGAATMVFVTANLLLVALFAIPAAVLVYVTYRADGGRGVLQQVRDTE